MRIVNARYIDSEVVSFDDLTKNALEGMLKGLDEHSRFLDRGSTALLEEHTGQSYVGVGIDIVVLNGQALIVNIVEGGPAGNAGLLPGDIIVAVDGRSVMDLPTAEVAQLLKGKEGTSVQLRVHRSGTPLPVKSLTRRNVDIGTVFAEPLSEEDVAYVRISYFGANTAAEFNRVLNSYEGQGMKGLVLDLRNNPGGLFFSGLQVAAEFFEMGELVVYTQSPNTRQIREYRSSTPARSNAYPIVVLVNNHSASAAEIVAGSLQDLNRGWIIGEPTYGKGSVQEIFPLSSGHAMQATTAYYFTHAGRSFDGHGLRPDLLLDLPEEAYLKIELQRRHSKMLPAEEFERLFGFRADEPDLQKEAANQLVEQLIKDPSANLASLLSAQNISLR